VRHFIDVGMCDGVHVDEPADATLICMRHAESDNTVARRAGALPDAALTTSGRHQARLCAETLARYSAAAIYTSTALRAHETAAIIAEHLDLPVVPVTGLEEVWLGRDEGSVDLATHQLTANVLHAWIVDGNLDARVADGESGLEVLQRVSSALNLIAGDNPTHPVIVIGHVASLTTGIHGLCGNGSQVWGSPMPHSVEFPLIRRHQTWHCTWPTAEA